MGEPNKKIVGATLIGFCILFASYTISNFGTPADNTAFNRQTNTASVATSNIAPRQPITVVDSNTDGIEDWREEFIASDVIEISQTPEGTSEYTEPDTVTEQVGIQLVESTLLARTAGPFGASSEEIVERTVNTLERVSSDKIFDTPDITIIPTTDSALYAYANAVMQVVIDNNLPNLDDEITLLDRYMNNQYDSANYEALTQKKLAYETMRNSTIGIPVPDLLVKEHLDLINSYHAIAQNITAMTNVTEDPLVVILRLKRYQDDATGLYLSFQNLFVALEPYARLFTIDDPAALLVNFSPNLQ
jgi:hypothetical protein